MSKPKCPYYPKEKAQRFCPVLKRAISSKACQEMYNIRFNCDKCVYLLPNVEAEEKRLFRRQLARLRQEFDHRNMDDEKFNQLMVFIRMEALIARYVQWYPVLDDEAVLSVLQTLMTNLKAFRAGLKYNADPLSGNADELRLAVEGRFGMTEMEKEKTSEIMPVYLDVMMNAIEMLMTSLARHRGPDPRSYIQFIVQFVDKEPPKSVADKLFVNPDDDTFEKRILPR